MLTLSREPVPLDRYRVSYSTDFVKHFFGLFLSFFNFFWLDRAAGGGRQGGVGGVYIRIMAGR